MYPMRVSDFAHWLHIFRLHFPSDETLQALGLSWYPGEPQDDHDDALEMSRKIDIRNKQGYRFWISNTGPDDGAILVGAMTKGDEAYFRTDGSLEDALPCGLDDKQLVEVTELLKAHSGEIRTAWKRFIDAARPAQARWMAILEADS